MAAPTATTSAPSPDAVAAKVKPSSSKPHLPEPPVNPFVNETVRLSPGEVIKLCTFGITLAPIRMILLLVLMGVTWGCAKLSLRGVSQTDLQEKPLPASNRRFLKPLPYLARSMLWLMGYLWITEHGKPDPNARLIVSNHIAFIETLYFGWRAFPSFVAKSDVMKYPIVGTIGKALQLVFVDRASADSRKATAESILKRAVEPNWPPLLIFPEGTCVNGKALISFRLGAFAPGAPVQPVAIRFPFVSFDPCWTVAVTNFPLHLWRMFSQLNNYMEVRWLPTHYPTEAEKAHPALYANKVRSSIAHALNIPTTDHSYDDVFFQIRAMKQHLGPELSGSLEISNLKRLYDFNPESIHALLKAFAASPTAFETGRMRYLEFCRALGFPPNPHTLAVFQLLDVDETGEIDFRTYLGGMAMLAKEIDPVEREKTIKFAFSLFDLQNSGKVSEEAFMSIMARPFPNMGPSDLHRLFKEGDTNKDGMVDYKEFSAFMTANPGYLKMFRIYADSQHYVIPGAAAAESPSVAEKKQQ